MSTSSCDQLVNRGYCLQCRKSVPVKRVQRDNCLYLLHECPDCGPTEQLLSRDARKYYEKRELVHYQGEAEKTCSMNCVGCSHPVTPYYVVVDVTNRCNMNCPICLANIPAMGMEFNPPLEYFEKVFQHLSKVAPQTKVDLFGGEPTCREDLIDIINLARKYSLSPRVVTNGIRFADEDYCKNIFATRAQLMLGLDGLDPEIQSKLRKNPGSLEKKLKAIENIQKHIKSKITIMCTTALGISEALMPGLIQLCYDKRELITRIMLLPLQATAGPEKVDVETTTVEDVEHIMADCFPGLEFVPVGALRKTKNIARVYGASLLLGGTHPNCECIALMVADTTAGIYRPAAHYLKVPFREFIKQLMAWDNQIGPKLERGLLGKLFGMRGQQIHMTLSLAGFARRYAKIGMILGPTPVRTVLRVLWTKLRTGRKLSKVAREHNIAANILQLVILPYEEPGCLESARVKDCPVTVACENRETGDIDLIPFCAYFVFKNDILRKSTERWGTVPVRGEIPSRGEAVAAG